MVKKTMALHDFVIGGKTMALHDFVIDGKIFRQKKGGSIGLDLVSDIFVWMG